MKKTESSLQYYKSCYMNAIISKWVVAVISIHFCCFVSIQLLYPSKDIASQLVDTAVASFVGVCVHALISGFIFLVNLQFVLFHILSIPSHDTSFSLYVIKRLLAGASRLPSVDLTNVCTVSYIWCFFFN